MNANHGIGRTRAPGDKADAWLAGNFSVGFGHVGYAAFLAAGYDLDLISAIMQRVQRRKVTLSGHTEQAFRSMVDQPVNQHFTTATFQFCHYIATSIWNPGFYRLRVIFSQYTA
jgi:hypothetical protein